MHKQKAMEQGCSLQLWLDVNHVPALLNLDRGRLIQVLTNMLSNAIKFTPSQGQVKIFVEWLPNETGLDLESRDKQQPYKDFINDMLITQHCFKPLVSFGVYAPTARCESILDKSQNGLRVENLEDSDDEFDEELSAENQDFPIEGDKWENKSVESSSNRSQKPRRNPDSLQNVAQVVTS